MDEVSLNRDLGGDTFGNEGYVVEFFIDLWFALSNGHFEYSPLTVMNKIIKYTETSLADRLKQGKSLIAEVGLIVEPYGRLLFYKGGISGGILNCIAL